MRKHTPRLARAGVWVGALALVGGAAIATGAIPAADGTVSGCVAKNARTSWTGLLGPKVTLDRQGTLRAIDAEAGQQCSADEQPLTFNVEGDPGATSVVVRHSPPVSVKANGSLTLRSTCNPGERATGGGPEWVSGGTDANLLGSHPTPLEGIPDGWEARWINKGAEDQLVQTYVVCAAP